MPSTPALDAFDLAILDILQRDNTTPQRAIAHAVHLSAPAVQRRIQKLQHFSTEGLKINGSSVDPTPGTRRPGRRR